MNFVTFGNFCSVQSLTLAIAWTYYYYYLCDWEIGPRHPNGTFCVFFEVNEELLSVALPECRVHSPLSASDRRREWCICLTDDSRVFWRGACACLVSLASRSLSRLGQHHHWFAHDAGSQAS